MKILQILVPIISFSYFLYRARRSPVYICGLPLFYSFGEAAFIRTYDWRLIIWVLPFDKQDLLFLLVVISWVYIRWRRPLYQKFTISLDLVSIMVFIALILFQIPLGLMVKFSGIVGMLLSSRIYFYFPLSILLWVDMFRRVTRDEIWALIRIFSLLTIPIMGLYSLSAVGVKIYPAEAYLTIYAGSAVVIRDFATFPYWARLAIAFYLVQLTQQGMEKTFSKSIGSSIALSFLIGGSLLSITRSYVIPIGAMVTMFIAYSFVKVRRFSQIWILVGLIIGAGLILRVYAPENVNVLADKFGEVASLQDIYKSSLGDRIRLFQELNQFVGQYDQLFGLGFNAIEGRSMGHGPVQYIGDMMWYSILGALGWSGIVALVIILIFALWDSGMLMVSQIPSRSQMGLILLMIMIFDLARSFASEGYFWCIATSTIPLALIAVEKRTLWTTAPLTVSLPRFFVGANPNWFIFEDKFKLWRRLALIALIGFVAVLIGLKVAG